MFRLPDVWYFDILDDGFLVVTRPMPTLSTLGINVVPNWSERVREQLARLG